MKPVAIVFDLFGTLLDIASLSTAAAAFTDEPAAFVATWREKQIAYAFAATIMDRYEDFDAITDRALHYAAARHGLDTSERGWTTLGAQWRNVRAFPDAVATLAQLREAGHVCAILTNGTPATAAAALESAGMSAAIDTTLSVDAVRVFKPDRRVYESARAHFNASPASIMFVTSNGWDATGAAEFGFNVVWCNRSQAPAETLGAPPSATIATLAELPALLAAAG